MKIAKSVLLTLAGLVFAALCVFLLPWLVTNVGADSGGAAETKSDAEVAPAYEININNLMASELADITKNPVIVPEKVYMLSEDTVIAPKPDESCFGSSTNPADTIPVMEAAERLMDGQDFVWDPDTVLFPNSSVKWYLDDTIFSVTWKEYVNNWTSYSFSEVKIAHPSQFRRYMADNTFANPIQYTPLEMAKTVNAVTAMNGDFYKFRPYGTVVYNRQLCRLSKYLDTCYVDTNGDLNFVYAGAMTTEAEVNQYVADNDILFSLAFGPVLIDNGVDVCPEHYLIGEIDGGYSRAVICQLGQCHYLLVTANYDTPYSHVPNARAVTDELLSKGVPNAYCLDGGQTSTMITHNEVFNHVDWGTQRAISDIIYFATAIPESEREG